MYPIEFYDPIEKTEFKDGMYRVGIDMPAGEYKVTSSSGYGYIEVTSDASHTLGAIITNDLVEDSTYQTVSEGQYVKLLGSHGHAGVSRPCSTRADGSRRRMREPSALSCDRAATAGVPPARAGGIRRA